MSKACATRPLEKFSDNTAAVSRVRKGAVSKPGPSAYLCQATSDHQRAHRYHHVAAYLPGPENVAAEDASRLQTLTDLAFHSPTCNSTIHCLNPGDSSPCDPRDGFLVDLGSALHTTETALVPKTRRSRSNHLPTLDRVLR